MTSATTSSMKRVLIAAAVVLAPTGSALAAPDCGRDPFAAYREAFNAGGPTSDCRGAAPLTGARGPAGPMMTSDRAACRHDPHYGVRQAFWGDGPAYECAASAGGAAGTQGRAGPLLSDARDGGGDAFGRYKNAFTAD